MVEQLFLFVLILVTSAATYLVGAKGLGLAAGRLGTAVAKMLEGIGLTALFFVGNLVAGMVAILAIRTLTPIFVSLYIADNIVLLVVSFLQALSFQWWRELGRRKRER